MGFEQNGNWYKNDTIKDELKKVVITDDSEVKDAPLDSWALETEGRTYAASRAGMQTMESGILETNTLPSHFSLENEDTEIAQVSTLFLNMYHNAVRSDSLEELSTAKKYFTQTVVPAFAVATTKIYNERISLIAEIKELQNNQMPSPDMAVLLKRKVDRLDELEKDDQGYEQEFYGLSALNEKLKLAVTNKQ